MSFIVYRVWDKNEPEVCEKFEDFTAAQIYLERESEIDYFHDYYIMERLGEMLIPADVSDGHAPVNEKYSKQALFEQGTLLCESVDLAVRAIDLAILTLESDGNYANALSRLRELRLRVREKAAEAFDRLSTN